MRSAAEDTRVTARLLDRYGIAKRLIQSTNTTRSARPCRSSNFSRPESRWLSRATRGTPASPIPARISWARCGTRVCRRADTGRERGAHRALAAGIAAPHFLFYGFLPSRAGERRRALAQVATLPYALVFYEAPHRVAACVTDLRVALGGERRMAIARELTKVYETIHRCTIAEAEAWLAGDPDRRRGEFVLIVEGVERARARSGRRRARDPRDPARRSAGQAGRRARREADRREANELYKLALELKRRD
jgi:16S rRNA (cytidine1402-2'-O)-methyltransferase